MQAIVLAAGRGTRMMPLTKNKPKAMVKINGKPMIQYVIELLAAHGVTEIGINLFYLGEQIKEYFGDGIKFGIKIRYIEEKELTGTAGGVKNISKILNPKEPFFVISSDMMVNFDLRAVYKFHLEHKGIATICCYERPIERILNKSGVVVYENSNLITKFIERPKTKREVISQWVSSSVYVFDPKIIKYIPDQVDNSVVVDLPKDIFSILLKKEKMYAYPVDKEKYYQLGIDSPERVIMAEKDIASGVFIPTN